jgi:hypothetical protein
MARIWLAIRIFFLVLFQGSVARLVAEVLEKRKMEKGEDAGKKPAAKIAGKTESKPAIAKQPPKPARSEAVTLLLRHPLYGRSGRRQLHGSSRWF